LWDLEKEVLVRKFAHESGWTSASGFSADGKRFLTYGSDGTVRLRDVNGKELCRFPPLDVPEGTLKIVSTAAFSPDGRFAVSATWGGTVQIWKLPPPDPVHTLIGHNDIVWGARFCLDGTHVVSAGGTRWEEDTKRWLDGSDFQLRLWDVRTGKEVRRFGDHTESVGWLAVSPDGKRVISSGGRTDNTMRLWDLLTGQLIRRYDKHSGVVHTVAFSPDGKRFASSSFDKSLRLWDVETGQAIHCFEEGKTVFRAIDFSRDGKYVLSGSDDGRLRLWNADTGELVRSLDGAYRALSTVNLSADGRFALSNGLTPEGRGTPELWDLEKNLSIRQFRHEWGWVTQGSGFSPDGKRFLTCGQDGTLRLWELATGKELCRFETPPSAATANAIATAAFSPDGRFAVSAGWDHNVRIWKLPE
jgi:WD40 repeat protein